MDAFVRVGKVSEIPPGSAKVVVVQGHPVALFNVDGTLYALSNVCLHRGGPVGEGVLDAATVTCPLHGWQYDVRTGMNLANPLARLKAYAVRVQGDDVLVAP
jgi:nitrite reductase/ring-hydroxylating ferredoxin subunit